MCCPDENTIAALLDGALSPAERSMLTTHIEQCDACGDLLGSLYQLESVDQTSRLQETAPPVALGPGWLLEPRSQLSRFKIIRPLGKGAMGQVFLARDTELGRRVAIKLMGVDGALEAAAVERFLVEARITARFNHPNIVTIHEVGQHQGRPYVALEYLDGQTLRWRLLQGTLAPPESLRIVIDVATALQEAHRNQVYHGDLKPENILLPRDGRLRVVDFGMARMVQETLVARGGEQVLEGPFTSETSTQRLCGTPAYMAPEQWTAGSCGGAADVWALGVISIEILTGKRPFVATDLPGLRREVIAQDPSLLERLRGDIPPQLWELVVHCLAHAPRQRPSAAEVVQQAQELLRRQRPAVDEDHCPFMGLHPFQEEHVEFFFGREHEISTFLQRMSEVPVLPILGTTGSGKSSFVQAGVIPRLREQGPLRLLSLRPGARPFLNLARGLQQTSTAPGPPQCAEEIAQILRDRPRLLALRLQEIADATGESR